jgi:hypothetical protein
LGRYGEEAWATNAHKVVFNFSDADRRLRFINQAMRLLGPHWTLISM